jgi:hypothetical protein
MSTTTQLLASAAPDALDIHHPAHPPSVHPTLASERRRRDGDAPPYPTEPRSGKPRRSRGKPKQSRAPPSYTGPVVVFTIKSFCAAHHICAVRFQGLIKEGCGPRLMRVGRRVYITADAAADWRAEREAETNT